MSVREGAIDRRLGIAGHLRAPGQTVHPERLAHFFARAVISVMSGPLASA